MAQMPRGEPRSVPDPVGEAYNEMLRRKRQETASFGADYFTPGRQLDSYKFERPSSATTTVNGREVCATQPDRPLAPPEVLEDNRRAITRAFTLANNPLGGAATGLAMLAGASPRVEAAAFALGAFGDALSSGYAARPKPVLRPSIPRQGQVAPPVSERPNVRLRELNSRGQATGVTATAVKSMLNTGSDVLRSIKPPGWLGNPPGKDNNQSRGHLLAKLLGGSGRDRRNLVTISQNPTNDPHMKSFEGAIADAVRKGEVVDYSVTPMYADGVFPPEHLLMTAQGSRGTRMGRVIFNPASRQRRQP